MSDKDNREGRRKALGFLRYLLAGLDAGVMAELLAEREAARRGREPRGATAEDLALPFHAGHVCPKCGATEYWCDGGDSDSDHSHRCACGYGWSHGPGGESACGVA